MEWRQDAGELVEWDWADGDGDGERYAIRIRIDGRRLRGREAQQWKERIATDHVEE